MQSLITWNTEEASSVTSNKWSKSRAGREITFCDDFRDNFGAFPGSTVTVISPLMTSSSYSDLGVWLALCFLVGDWEVDLTGPGVVDGDLLKPLGVGACSYSLLTSIVSSVSSGDATSSSFIPPRALSTASDFISRVSSAIVTNSTAETFEVWWWCAVVCGCFRRSKPKLRGFFARAKPLPTTLTPPRNQNVIGENRKIHRIPPLCADRR